MVSFLEVTDHGFVVNSIFWGALEGYPMVVGDVSVSYSFFERSHEGEGNIFGSPGFTSYQNKKYTLKSTSLCIDTGVKEGISDTDLLGNIRVFGAGVDMGAYEYVEPPTPTPTPTASPSPTESPTLTETPTPTETPTSTPTVTPTESPTPEPPTPTETETPVPPTPTVSPTPETPTPTKTPTPTPSPSDIPPTETVTPTETPVSPSPTDTPTPVPPTPTATDTPAHTESPTPSPSPEPLPLSEIVEGFLDPKTELDERADLNGDGIIDAADLLLAQ